MQSLATATRPQFRNRFLDTAQIDVWAADLDQMPIPATPHVSADEACRARRFKRQLHQRRFLAARHFLRLLLACYLDCNPAELRFAYGRYGKPIAQHPKTPKIHFNQSHSENLLRIAVTQIGPIGIDVEKHRPMDDENELARRFFEKEEYREYLSLPEPIRTKGFYKVWTTKEAFLKATGMGLQIPLDSFRVSADPRKPSQLLAFPSLPGQVDQWTTRSIELDDSSTTTLAINAPSASVIDFQLHQTSPEIYQRI